MYADGWVFWHKLNGLPAALGFCRLGKLILHVALNMHLLHSACSALNSPLNTRENVARGRWGSTRNTDAGILCAAGRACLPGPWPVMFSDLPSSRFNRQVISGRACAVDRHPWMSEESLRLASFSPLKTENPQDSFLRGSQRLLTRLSWTSQYGVHVHCTGCRWGLGEWIHTASVCVCVCVFDFLFCTGV